MARAHQQHADQDGPLCAQKPVGDPAADQGREIDQPRIPAINDRGEGQVGHRCVEPDHASQGGQPNNFGGVVRQQILDHVQGQQRRHSVKGKAFPRFGESQIIKTLGMAA